MTKYKKKYSYKEYKIRETTEGMFDVFKPSWDEHEPLFEEITDIKQAKLLIESDIKADKEEIALKENAVREYAKRFNMICEYSFGTVVEEDEVPPEGEQADPNAAPPAEGDPNAMPPEGDPNAPPPAEGDPNAIPPEGEYEDVEMEGEEGGLQPEDNVIDVSQITGAQQETNDEMKQLADKFEQLLKLNDKVTQTLDRLAQAAEDSNKEVQSVKSDLAQRVPTELEKLKGRKTQSDPYNQTVEDFWRQRPGGDKYDIYPDDEKDEEYILRKSDIESINPQTVYNSFNQKLRDIVGYN